MRLGATLTHLSPGPPYAVAEWARRLVGEGFESLWTPQLIGRGSLVPDPFVVLAAAATATEDSPDVELGRRPCRRRSTTPPTSPAVALVDRPGQAASSRTATSRFSRHAAR